MGVLQSFPVLHNFESCPHRVAKGLITWTGWNPEGSVPGNYFCLYGSPAQRRRVRKGVMARAATAARREIRAAYFGTQSNLNPSMRPGQSSLGVKNIIAWEIRYASTRCTFLLFHKYFCFPPLGRMLLFRFCGTRPGAGWKFYGRKIFVQLASGPLEVFRVVDEMFNELGKGFQMFQRTLFDLFFLD